MRLLMITRKIDKDDGLAGFTFNWVKNLANHVDHLDVMCLEKGNAHGLPDNVVVHSLGKEKGKNRWREFWRFHKYGKKLVPKVDGVFAHQNPEYGILISFWTKIYKKKLIAWYTHKSVGWKLKLLNKKADIMLTASKESFRLASDKLKVLHHGIDTDIFSFKSKFEHEGLRLLSVSRISNTKKIDLMIDIVDKLKNKFNQKVILKIIGVPTLKQDKKYLNNLKKQVKKLGLENNIDFVGSVANDQTPKFYQEADIFLNFSATGSLDKTVLESMSCGTLVLVGNEAFKTILSPINNLLYIENFDEISDRIFKLLKIDTSEFLQSLRQYVIDYHSLDSLAKKIIKQFDEK